MPMSSYEIHCGLAGEPTTDVWQYKKQYIVYRIYHPARLNCKRLTAWTWGTSYPQWKGESNLSVSWAGFMRILRVSRVMNHFFFWGGALWYLWMFVVFVCLWHGLGGPSQGTPAPRWLKSIGPHWYPTKSLLDQEVAVGICRNDLPRAHQS